MESTKIVIIGAGNVGSTTAYALLLNNVGSILCFIDCDDKVCKGQVADLSDALSFHDAATLYQGTYNDLSDADIVIITAGKSQTQHQSRLDLTQTNTKILTSIAQQSHSINKEAVIIIVTNPVDIITYYAQKLFSVPSSHIIGTGTFLDSKRFQGALAGKLGVAEQSIHAYILGEHGDSQFPAWSCSSCAGKPLSSFTQLTEKACHVITQTVQQKAYDIITHKGATYFGIASCIVELCTSILFDQKKVFPLSHYIPEFDVCLSIPVSLGRNGIGQTIDLPLNDEEQLLLRQSAQTIRKYLYND